MDGIFCRAEKQLESVFRRHYHSDVLGQIQHAIAMIDKLMM